ncbi:terminase [Streptococcus suis]|uniref:terminase n=1 Tax=Streptococcus suis TaxID=1307 RepID=UPI002875DEA3|nr:terminase [Streptococcus suis]MDS1161627.1 terminase [Streptococcus suis]
MVLTSNFPLSQKYIDFCNTFKNVDADFLEGTTAAGKTTVGVGVKFMRAVSRSNKKFHIIAAKTVGVAEKNLINQDNGILDLHKTAIYKSDGDKDAKLPHIKFEGKIIYVLGYDNKDKWKLVLGGQYGCVYIDEMNTADIEFIREMSTRNDYMMGTLNPDDPNLPVYKEFVNRSRPYKKYASDVPKEILEELKEPVNSKWRYWFFSFEDNLSLTPEAIQKKKDSAPVGTKMYKNKILGLRGRAEGLIFPMFERQRNVIARSQAKKFDYVKYSCGVDTSYSEHSNDTIAFMFQGITKDGKLVTLAEKVYNNKDLNGDKIAPSDVVQLLHKFLDNCKDSWGFARKIYVDSADQATVMELRKYASKYGLIYEFMNANKSIKIIDRINLMAGWMKQECYLVVEDCIEHIHELEVYSWKENKDEPEDRNDHTINAGQYGWIPHLKQIGNKQANANQFDTLRAGFGL